MCNVIGVLAIHTIPTRTCTSCTPSTLYSVSYLGNVQPSTHVPVYEIGHPLFCRMSMFRNLPWDLLQPQCWSPSQAPPPAPASECCPSPVWTLSSAQPLSTLTTLCSRSHAPLPWRRLQNRERPGNREILLEPSRLRRHLALRNLHVLAWANPPGRPGNSSTGSRLPLRNPANPCCTLSLPRHLAPP